MRRISLVMTLAACGRFDFDDRAPADDAAARDAGTSCAEAWSAGPPAFEALQAIAGANVAFANDKNPFVSADGSTLYFASDRGGGLGGVDFWSAPITGFATTGAPTLFTALDTPADEGRLELSADGSLAVFSSERPPSGSGSASGNFDLWIGTHDSGDTWTASESAVALLETAGDDKDPHWNHDRSTLYYSSNATLMSATLATNGDYTSKAALPTTFTGLGALDDPWVSDDDTLLVFTAVPSGTSDRDIYMSTRADPGGQFTTARALTALNIGSDQQDVFVTPDRCEVWFAAYGSGSGSATLDIYVAQVHR